MKGWFGFNVDPILRQISFCVYNQFMGRMIWVGCFWLCSRQGHLALITNLLRFRFQEIQIYLLAYLYNPINLPVTLVSLEGEALLTLEPLVIILVDPLLILVDCVINYTIYRCLRQLTTDFHNQKTQNVQGLTLLYALRFIINWILLYSQFYGHDLFSFLVLQRHPAITLPSYPQVQAPVVNNPVFWERVGAEPYGTDTLFFAFYYQQVLEHTVWWVSCNWISRD